MARPHPRRERRRCAEGARRACSTPQRGDRLSGTGERRNDAAASDRTVPASARPCAACRRPAQAADIKPIDLGKNVEVWFSEDHTVPIIAFDISLPAGSAYDPAGKAGLADFAADLIDEGAGNMDSRAFHEALADHAIQFRASTERDNLVISVVTLSENCAAGDASAATRADPSAFRRRSGDAGARPDDPGHPGRQYRARPRVARRVFCQAISSTAIPMAIPAMATSPACPSITADDLRNLPAPIG